VGDPLKQPHLVLQDVGVKVHVSRRASQRGYASVHRLDRRVQCIQDVTAAQGVLLDLGVGSALGSCVWIRKHAAIAKGR